MIDACVYGIDNDVDIHTVVVKYHDIMIINKY